MTDTPQQRPLKFRAWDHEARAMIEEWIFSQEYNYVVPGETIEMHQLVQTHDLHLMQFTGFYDRSGKEIYEGDVLLSREADTGIEEELFEMFYELGGFCLVDYPRSEQSEAYTSYRNWFNSASRNPDTSVPQPSCRFDVVGHIHEPHERIEQRVMALHDASSIVREEPLSADAEDDADPNWPEEEEIADWTDEA